MSTLISNNAIVAMPRTALLEAPPTRRALLWQQAAPGVPLQQQIAIAALGARQQQQQQQQQPPPTTPGAGGNAVAGMNNNNNNYGARERSAPAVSPFTVPLPAEQLRGLATDARLVRLADVPHYVPQIAALCMETWPESYHELGLPDTAALERDVRRFTNPRVNAPIYFVIEGVLHTPSNWTTRFPPKQPGDRQMLAMIALDIKPDLAAFRHAEHPELPVGPWVTSVMVMPELRSCGLGRVLITHMLQHIDQRIGPMFAPCSYLYCDSKELQSWYGRYGYETVCEAPCGHERVFVMCRKTPLDDDVPAAQRSSATAA